MFFWLLKIVVVLNHISLNWANVKAKIGGKMSQNWLNVGCCNLQWKFGRTRISVDTLALRSHVPLQFLVLPKLHWCCKVALVIDVFNSIQIFTSKNEFTFNIPLIFQNFLKPVSHQYNTRYAAKSNFKRLMVTTNYGEHTFQYAATKIWELVPIGIKSLPFYPFKKSYKRYLLLNLESILRGNSTPKTSCIHMKHLTSISLIMKYYSVAIFS